MKNSRPRSSLNGCALQLDPRADDQLVTSEPNAPRPDHQLEVSEPNALAALKPKPLSQLETSEPHAPSEPSCNPANKPELNAPRPELNFAIPEPNAPMPLNRLLSPAVSSRAFATISLALSVESF